MNVIKKRIAACCAAVLVLAGMYFFWFSPRYTVPVLTYHSFDVSGIADMLLSVTPSRFEQQMAFLKKHGYQVVSFNEVAEGLKAGKQFAHNTVAITIDDGYQNNYEYAYPVLKKYGFPAIIFVATDVMSLSWDEIKEMAANGIAFGGHTRHHVYLPGIDDKNVLWDEIDGSKKALEAHGLAAKYFCYPIGGFTTEVKALVQKAGYKAACTTNRGRDPRNREDAYEINRVSIRNSDNPFIFWAKLSGYYNVFRARKELRE
ncbi:MAG: polysaccharide deacetylase family protein [Candidatus Omnitrophica bacterium]|nr:polysaccharide deacetylase family protein [Candidatus Omnitrophota bacterium]